MPKKKQKLTPVSALGEFGLIEELTKNFSPRNASTLKSIGDDAAVLGFGNNAFVVTTDLLVEGIHFNPAYASLKHLGYKAVVVNLSDVYAMNATPTQITVSVALSNRVSLEAMQAFYEGIELACQRYNVDLVGGDTTSSLRGLFISVTAIGEVANDRIAYRSGAKPTDLICVSGDLGAAYAGLQLLEREKEVFKADPNMNPHFEGYDYILERQLKPEARKDIVEFFEREHILPTAMIDVSDGLSSEIMHIAKQSGVGAKLFEEKIPFDTQTINMAEELHIDPTTFALNGGEDYELLFCLPLKYYEAVRNNPAFSIIGHIVPPGEGTNLIARDGTALALKAQGWNPLSQK